MMKMGVALYRARSDIMSSSVAKGVEIVMVALLLLAATGDEARETSQ